MLPLFAVAGLCKLCVVSKGFVCNRCVCVCVCYEHGPSMIAWALSSSWQVSSSQSDVTGFKLHNLLILSLRRLWLKEAKVARGLTDRWWKHEKKCKAYVDWYCKCMCSSTCGHAVIHVGTGHQDSQPVNGTVRHTRMKHDSVDVSMVKRYLISYIHRSEMLTEPTD